MDGRTVTEVDVNGTVSDVETTICYLGDMLCSGGGCDSAIIIRCGMAWGKLRKLLFKQFITKTHRRPKLVSDFAFLANIISHLHSEVVQHQG